MRFSHLCVSACQLGTTHTHPENFRHSSAAQSLDRIRHNIRRLTDPLYLGIHQLRRPGNLSGPFQADTSRLNTHCTQQLNSLPCIGLRDNSGTSLAKLHHNCRGNHLARMDRTTYTGLSRPCLDRYSNRTHHTIRGPDLRSQVNRQCTIGHLR